MSARSRIEQIIDDACQSGEGVDSVGSMVAMFRVLADEIDKPGRYEAVPVVGEVIVADATEVLPPA